MHWIYLIHEFHKLSWITEINELFHDILIYWDAPVVYVKWDMAMFDFGQLLCAAVLDESNHDLVVKPL